MILVLNIYVRDIETRASLQQYRYINVRIYIPILKYSFMSAILSSVLFYMCLVEEEVQVEQEKKRYPCQKKKK